MAAPGFALSYGFLQHFVSAYDRRGRLGGIMALALDILLVPREALGLVQVKNRPFHVESRRIRNNQPDQFFKFSRVCNLDVQIPRDDSRRRLRRDPASSDRRNSQPQQVFGNGMDELEDAHLLSLALERIVNSDPAALIPEKEVWDSLGITEEDLDASSKQAARTVVL